MKIKWLALGIILTIAGGVLLGVPEIVAGILLLFFGIVSLVTGLVN